MVTKQEANGKVQVTFTMPAIEGCESLYLLGDFNEWNAMAHPMQHAEDGTWSLTLELEPSREYQFRYCGGDGIWHNDLTTDAYIPNPYGSDNSVVRT